MKLVRLFGAMTCLLAIAGCAHVPATPAATTDAAPARWFAPLPHGGTLADLTRWWQQFNDPLLPDLITAAQGASPTVATAGSRIAQARATRVAAQSALLPGVDANASLARGTAQTGVPLATTLQAGVQAGWELDLFGGNRAALRGAQARLEGAQAGWHEARVAVAAEAATTYLDLRTCDRQLAVTRNDGRSRAETARLTRLSADAGFTAPAVAALARASAAEASARSTQQQAQCDLLVKALVALTAIDEAALRTRLQAQWVEPERFALLTVPALPAQLLLQRPDVYQAARSLAAARADVQSAHAQRLPQVSLTGQIGRVALHAGGHTLSDNTWSIGPLAITMPLFDAGRRAAAEDAALARYEEAGALFGASVRQSVREVEQALVNLESARERSQDALVAVEGYRASFAATQARYRSGLGSLIELEDQRRVTLSAEMALVALQRERIASWIALYRAVGGGWMPPGTETASQP